MNKELTETKTAEQSEIVLNIVFKSLKGIYPAWRTSIKTQIELDNMKFEWLRAFIESNINTDTQINRALRCARADKNPFMPSLGLFLEWAKPPTAAFNPYDTSKQLVHEKKKLSLTEIKAMKVRLMNGYKDN